MFKYLNNMRLFVVLFALTMTEYLPKSLIAIIKIVLFVWMAVVEIKEITHAKKDKHNITIWIVLGLLMIVCCYDLLINFCNGGELRWTMLLGTSIIAIMFFDYVRLKGDIKLVELFVEVANICLIISLFDVLYQVINDYEARRYILKYCGYSNGLGAYVPPLLVFNLFFLKKNPKNYLLLVGTITGIIQAIAVRSITTIAAIVCILVYFVLVRNKFIKKLISPTLILIISLVIFFIFPVFEAYDFPVTRYIIVNILQRNMSLSYRTIVWEKAIAYIKESLIFGHGSDTLTQQLFYGLKYVTNCHNYYLDILARSGVVGLILIIMNYIVDIIYVKKMDDDSRMFLVYYFLLLIPWQFESYCNYFGYPLFYMVLLFALCVKDIKINQSIKKKYSEDTNNYFVFKRCMDILISLIGVVITCIVGLVIFVLKKGMKEKTSLIYKQKRIGKDGKIFTIYKFRTMVENADDILDKLISKDRNKEEWEKYHKLLNDERITSLGKILRKYSIDELPQFFNCLIGDMSIIGPRPLINGELEAHGGDPEIYWAIKPGITSLWACSGRNDMDYRERLELEYNYIRNCSLSLDISLFFKTIKTMFIERNGQ